MKSLRIALVASACLVAATASAQPGQVGAQATSGQPLPRTPWGDPDLRGTWPLQNINDARIRHIKDRLNGFGGSGNSYVFADVEDFPGVKERISGDAGSKRRASIAIVAVTAPKNVCSVK